MKTEATREYFEDDLKPEVSREYLEDGEDEYHLQEECTNFQKDLRDFISNMRTKSDCGKIGGPSQSVSAEIEAGSLMGEYGSFLGECKDCVDLQKTLRQIEVNNH